MRSAACHKHALKLQQRDSHVQRQKVCIMSLSYMAKRIGESAAGDSHGWILQKLSMIDNVKKMTKYRGIRYHRTGMTVFLETVYIETI